ncbi:MAG: hypothetical protein ACRDHN_13320 [Thermomicrobiales bacterium]
MTDTAMHPVIEEYLSLAHAIERAFPGFIDAYHGPETIKVQALAAPDATPATLLERTEALAAAIESMEIEAPRRRFLRAQVRAEITIARKLAGEPVPFTEEVATLFDIEPAHTPEANFDESIAELNDLLPGSGDVRERMVAWRDRSVISPEIARQMIDRISAEARRRTLELIELPAVESVEFAMVHDKPWSGYNWFLGSGKSLVEINTDLPIRATSIPDLIAHEAYPGHHTEHALKEIELFHGKGWGEYAVQLINTPECVISEGIATLAAGWIFDGDEAERWIADDLKQATGIALDAEREFAIDRASKSFRAIGANAALLLHDRGASEDEVVAYMMRYGLEEETRARHRMTFIGDPLWRAYIFCYHAGRDLLSAWLDLVPEERNARIRTLMLEPITPGQIAEQL